MTFVTDAERPHLGGYILGGDEATFYPELWFFLVEDYGVRSVIDVGCGEGHACEYFASLGCDVTGVDGVSQEATWNFLRHDFTEGRLGLGKLDFSVDLCWSCEFVEHVEERYIPNFLETFQCAELVLMTHALPGQPGHHHVNCREPEYWKGVMAAIGYQENTQLTALTRELAAANEHPLNHYAQRGLAFERN